ncbi:porin [Echinimonas agarilytica]|uniref:Porin n=1 Tax=Echinimonas agarilytica TaxID=1215918 RepID=A0AA41W7J1_9GAMM|nr:porin [Echinimonas agarilytica]MCM2679971.1 porin [Echinimonas agarilytica]
MMWIKRTLALAVIAGSTSTQAFELYKGDELTAQMKGYLELNGIYTDSDTSFKDGTSRIGFQFDHPVNEEWNIGAYLEWGVRTTNSGKDLKISGDEQASLSSGDPDDAISLRQGNVYLSHDQWGDIKIGKQWSVYYDASFTTDVYNVFGGEASGTYNFASDGGLSGTGRADNAITWRKSYQGLDIGLQGQFSPGELDASDFDSTSEDDIRLSTIDGEFDYGYSMSLGYTFDVGMPLSIRGAYNYALIEVKGEVDGTQVSDVDDEAWVGSITLGETLFAKGFYASVSYAQSENHEFDAQGIIYDAEGWETVIGYGFSDQWQVFVGNNLLKADDSDYAAALERYLDDNPSAGPLTDDYELSYYVAGVNYNWSHRINLFAEIRVDDSDFNGTDGEDIYALGLRFNL